MLFLKPAAFGEPPFNEKSSPPITTGLLFILPNPRMKLPGVKFLRDPLSLYSEYPALLPISLKELLSSILLILSLIGRRPFLYCRSTASLPPIWSAKFLFSLISFASFSQVNVSLQLIVSRYL